MFEYTPSHEREEKKKKCVLIFLTFSNRDKKKLITIVCTRASDEWWPIKLRVTEFSVHMLFNCISKYDLIVVVSASLCVRMILIEIECQLSTFHYNLLHDYDAMSGEKSDNIACIDFEL